MTAKSHRNALQPGYKVLWYQIDRVLGQGGFGITYLAHDPNLDQRVAIKEYLPIEFAVREHDYSVHPMSEDHGHAFAWGKNRFMEEARTLAKFDHPNIVRVYSVFEENNTAYMVMRYEAGQSLQELLPRGGSLEEGQLMNILVPILGGLRSVHKAGFIHRDIKPANIFIHEDGSPVLLDFGSARLAIGHETRTLTTLVSPGYAPFEQYHSKSDQQGPWSDIYGLGATLYRAVTGRQPIDAVDRSERLLKGVQDPFRPASVLAADRYSQRFLTAIDHALAFREADRPQTIDEWLDEFGVQLDTQPETQDSADKPVRESDIATVAAPHLAIPNDIKATEADAHSSSASAPEAKQQAVDESGNLYRMFIGPGNTDYYLKRFHAFDGRGGGLAMSWHWPAALFTFLWMLYRRLYLWAFVLYPLITVIGVVSVLAMVSVLFFSGGNMPDRMAGTLAMLVAVIWPGLFANAIYYRRMKKRIARMYLLDLGDEAGQSWLATKGGTSKKALVMGIVAIVLVLLLMLAIQKDEQTQTESGAAQIESLLARAREDFDALRLTTPPGKNALEKLRQVLELEPDNRQAKEGIESIASKYVELANVAQEHEEFAKAQNYLERAHKLAPDSKEIKRGLLENYIKQGRKAWKQDRDLKAASRYLDRALQLAPNNPELRRFKRRLDEKLRQGGPDGKFRPRRLDGKLRQRRDY